MTTNVLVVEDDEAVRMMLRVMLEDEGFRVIEASTGRQAVERCRDQPLDLVLLDIRMPEMGGFDACRLIRSDNDVPIIFLSANDDSHDIVVGLELGADDYVTKPFGEPELMARVRAQLRRNRDRAVARRAVFAVGDLEIRPFEGVVLKAGVPVSLTKTEFVLLCHLAEHPQRIYTRELLLEQVWGYDHPGDGRLVDAHVRRLRMKVENDPSEPTLIVTVRGLGYKLVS